MSFGRIYESWKGEDEQFIDLHGPSLVSICVDLFCWSGCARILEWLCLSSLGGILLSALLCFVEGFCRLFCFYWRAGVLDLVSPGSVCFALFRNSVVCFARCVRRGGVRWLVLVDGGSGLLLCCICLRLVGLGCFRLSVLAGLN